MKTIEKYIKESLLDDEDDLVDGALYQPKDKDELIKAIKACLDAKIYDLNCIDTSKITDMSHLFDMSFSYTSFNLLKKYKNHLTKIDISKWDTSNVEDMSFMFYCSDFNGDISKWNVSNVKDMNNMFAYSKFNKDISKWNVSKVTNMNSMFYYSQFNGDVSKWNISKDTSTNNMF